MVAPREAGGGVVEHRLGALAGGGQFQRVFFERRDREQPWRSFFLAYASALAKVVQWPTIGAMNFGWDEAKSIQYFEHRDFDFAYVAHAFLDPYRVIRADQRLEYGEDRLQMLGQVQGRVFHVVFTMRGVAIRIISARKANLREVNDYENGAYQT